MSVKPPGSAVGDVAPNPVYGMPGHLIRRCHQIAVAMFIEECAGFEITPQQYATLRILASNDGVDQITLAGLAAFNRTTAGEIIGRMETAGLLKRRDGRVDRRVRNIHITAAGRKRLAAVEAAVARVQERILRPLDRTERRRFIDYLARIASENNEHSRAPLRPAGATRADA